MPTQGFNIKSLSHGNFKFDLWDLGGITWNLTRYRSKSNSRSLEELLRSSASNRNSYN